VKRQSVIRFFRTAQPGSGARFRAMLGAVSGECRRFRPCAIIEDARGHFSENLIHFPTLNAQFPF
jgi:hypothetical protein